MGVAMVVMLGILRPNLSTSRLFFGSNDARLLGKSMECSVSITGHPMNLSIVGTRDKHQESN